MQDSDEGRDKEQGGFKTNARQRKAKQDVNTTAETTAPEGQAGWMTGEQGGRVGEMSGRAGTIRQARRMSGNVRGAYGASGRSRSGLWTGSMRAGRSRIAYDGQGSYRIRRRAVGETGGKRECVREYRKANTGKRGVRSRVTASVWFLERWRAKRRSAG